MLRNFGMLALLSAPALAQTNDTAAPSQLSNSPTPVVSIPVQTGGGSYSAVLHDNGNYITGIGNGSGGANTSEIQTGYNTFGYNQALSAAARLADDFVVPAGKTWTLSKLHWFGYQTGSGTTSSINTVYVQIWSGAPGPLGGATLLAGNLTTNRLTSSAWTGVYRVTATTLLDVNRPVMEDQIDMSWAPVLPAGTYWLDVQVGGTLASGPWGNPTVPFVSTDNGQQFFGGAWAPVQDNIALTAQDFPFKLEGTEATGTTIYCTAKITSNSCTPSIGSSGAASATAGSGFIVSATNVINNKNGLLFYGTTGQASLPFQGGTLCVKVPVRRTGSTNSGGNPPPNDCSGVFSLDMNAFAVSPGPPVPAPALTVPGTVVDCQWWGRDPGFAAPNNTQLSNGLEYTVGP
jgi:hypothetical protein